jgi:hypothetical protein
MSTVQSIAEIALGLLFGVGGVFNTVYTFRHGDEFYGSFAKGARVPGARSIIERAVIPNSGVFTVMLILFQAVVAIMILSQGAMVTTGLAAGAIFSFVAALFSSPGGTIGNLALAAILIALAASH